MARKRCMRFWYETRDYFITTIYIRDDFEQGKQNKAEDKILDYLNQNQCITTSIASNLLELSPQRARAILSKMVKDELIVVDGSYRNRTYKLKI